jgi:hypothetical protein
MALTAANIPFGPEERQRFESDGFVILPDIIPPSGVEALNVSCRLRSRRCGRETVLIMESLSFTTYTASASHCATVVPCCLKQRLSHCVPARLMPGWTAARDRRPAS